MRGILQQRQQLGEQQIGDVSDQRSRGRLQQVHGAARMPGKAGHHAPLRARRRQPPVIRVGAPSRRAAPRRWIYATEGREHCAVASRAEEVRWRKLPGRPWTAERRSSAQGRRSSKWRFCNRGERRARRTRRSPALDESIAAHAATDQRLSASSARDALRPRRRWPDHRRPGRPAGRGRPRREHAGEHHRLAYDAVHLSRTLPHPALPPPPPLRPSSLTS